MTKEKQIEQAARDLMVFLDDKYTIDAISYLKNTNEYKNFKQALDPKPEKPSREEYINRLNRMIQNCNLEDVKTGYQYEDDVIGAIKLLQEPQKGVWIKNTGVEPDCTLVLIRFRNGASPIDVKSVEAEYWGLDTLNSITEYMIIE